MRKLRTLVLIISSMLMLNLQIYAQNLGIGTSSFNPDTSALVEMRGTKGLLIPRMSTAERNAIANPAQSLLIFNTTTKCFETYVDGAWNAIWCACGSVNITASATPSSVCQGTSTILSASGASTYTWSHSLGSGSSITVTPASTTTYTVTGTSTAGCTGTATVSVTVNPLPTVTASANPATINSGESSTLTASGASTYSWSTGGSTASITVTPSTSTTYTVTGTSTSGCTSTATVSVTVNTWSCGNNLTVTHTAGSVAPVNKTVTYGTVLTNLSGSNKCWITQNLGSDHQATSATDNTEASAGWYWQFNRKQGYKHDGTTRTPSTPWISSIDETSDWTSANDPCALLLGTGWRIPTKTEWENADVNGGWDNYNETYASVLKLHAAGYLNSTAGSLTNRGSAGYYWSSPQNSGTNGWTLYFRSGASDMNSSRKAHGFSLRCLRD